MWLVFFFFLMHNVLDGCILYEMHKLLDVSLVPPSILSVSLTTHPRAGCKKWQQSVCIPEPLPKQVPRSKHSRLLPDNVSGWQQV